VARLLRCDYDKEFVLIAEANGRLSGVAAYFRNGRSPESRGGGLHHRRRVTGTRCWDTECWRSSPSIARDHQIETFDAYVLHENERMMNVFLDSGFELQRRLERGVVHVVLSLRPTPVYEAKAAERSQTAAVASMKHFFEPRSVAVIGANRERGKIGSEILHNLTSGGFTGRLFAVHPSAQSIQGIPAYHA
jgi:hypothetical protein